MSKVMCARVAVLLCWAWLARAAAAPAHPHRALKVALSQAQNDTLCPLRVHVDEVPHRVPRRIKMLKCANRPNPACAAAAAGPAASHACCRSHHRGFHTQCVELTDSVLVRYTGQGDDERLHPLTVSVGCACLVRGETQALTDR